MALFFWENILSIQNKINGNNDQLKQAYFAVVLALFTFPFTFIQKNKDQNPISNYKFITIAF